jgi:hypothetical protein
VNATQTRVRSMKARRSSTCQCGRTILVGARITRHGGRWLCTDCAITIARTANTATTGQIRTTAP